jgi:hypothetical protein
VAVEQASPIIPLTWTVQRSFESIPEEIQCLSHAEELEPSEPDPGPCINDLTFKFIGISRSNQTAAFRYTTHLNLLCIVLFMKESLFFLSKNGRVSTKTFPYCCCKTHLPEGTYGFGSIASTPLIWLPQPCTPIFTAYTSN